MLLPHILHITSILPTKDSLLGVKQSACGFFTPEGGRINTHFAAFFEIYKISIPLHRSDLENSVKNRHQFCEIEYWKFNRNITIFAGKLLFLAEIEVKFCRNFANVLQNIQTQWGFASFFRKRILRHVVGRVRVPLKTQTVDREWKVEFNSLDRLLIVDTILVDS